jgi:hypothetical protein
MRIAVGRLSLVQWRGRLRKCEEEEQGEEWKGRMAAMVNAAAMIRHLRGSHHRHQLLVASSPCFCSLRLRRSIIDFRLITSSCCSTQSSIIPPATHTHTFAPVQFPARAAVNPATRLRRRYSHAIGSHSRHHHTCVGNLHPVCQSRQRHGRRVPVKLRVLSGTKSFRKNAALFGRLPGRRLLQGCRLVRLLS